MILTKSELEAKRNKLEMAVELLWENLVVNDFEKSRLLKEVEKKMDVLMKRAVSN